jgi:hypothetical protein
MMAKVAYIEIDQLDSDQHWRKLSHIDVFDILYVGETPKNVVQMEPASGYLERKFSGNFQAGESEHGLTIWRRPELPPRLHFLSSYRARIIETTGETASVPITIGGEDELLVTKSIELDLSFMPLDKSVCTDWH